MCGAGGGESSEGGRRRRHHREWIEGHRRQTRAEDGNDLSGRGEKHDVHQAVPGANRGADAEGGATGPERPKRMRPDGAVCYVEGKNGGLGVKRRNVKQGEQTGRPPGRPPEG